MTDTKTDDEISARDVAKGAGTTLLARLGGVLEVVAQPLYIWLFGLAGYGFYGALWAATNLTQNVADLGTTGAMQRVIPQATSAQKEAAALRAALILGVIPCILIAITVFILAEPVSKFFNADARDSAQATEIIRLFIWALPLWSFVEVATSALRARRIFGAEIRLRLFWEQLIRLLVVVSLFFAGWSTRALYIGHLISLGATCLLCVRLLAKNFELRLMFKGPLVDDMFHATLKAGLAVLPTNIALRIFGDGPAIALNAILPGASGAVATSLYIVARKISSLVQLVRTAFAYVLAPLASALSKDGKEKVSSIYGFSTRVLVTLALPLAAVLGAMGPTILPVFGPGVEQALIAVWILLASRAFEAVCGAAAPIQQVVSAHRHQLVGSITGVVLAFVIGGYFTPQYGLNAMAWAVAIGLAAASAIPMIQLNLHDDLHPFERPFLAVLLKALGVAIAGSLLIVAIQFVPLLAQRVLFAGLVLVAFAFAPRVAIGLAFVGLAEWVIETQFSLPAQLLSRLVTIVLMLPVVIGTLWLSLRLALPEADRRAIGDKTARKLRLV
ncbi:lipopolysaccharide biosynthesis protein [Sphingorhabdus lacus]|uniref:Polysaccharide biosynthesis protein n=1 Tax=Sphingorhabdus lacus TaxID=392610 RepID=A0A6I6LFW5_9SPHN|nr:polysaccharide biosynthesis protein [Sphingorhabdus lacus]QGY81203.1 polysaccharide biosynthesis protein [Sphingorhabdus lacus]